MFIIHKYIFIKNNFPTRILKKQLRLYLCKILCYIVDLLEFLNIHTLRKVKVWNYPPLYILNE